MFLTFIRKKADRYVAPTQDYTIDDVFNGVAYNALPTPTLPDQDEYVTKTVITSENPSSWNKEEQTRILKKLRDLTRNHDKEQLILEYSTFYIPKKTGGLREINAPNEILMNDLREMKNIFQYELKVLYHNAAHAYTPKRNILSALKEHQRKDARWFLKLDVKDFFPSCTQEFVVKQLRKLYPFNNWTTQQINSFIWLCFREDKLPQGTPMSPMLTNLIMIPFDMLMTDYAKSNGLTYTRYADDILISSAAKWDWQITQRAVDKAFENLGYPFRLKTEKTRFGSCAGRNWNLGLMYNKDKQITVGYKKKKEFKAMLFNLLTAETQQDYWDREDVQHFQGITSYYLSIEPQFFKEMISKYEEKFGITLKQIYKRAL